MSLKDTAMGGVPVLLMIAAMGMGITYGWQPDESGQGVEYLIQVPPSAVDELQRVGEISSVIDPAVRGHVSRIVIRTGNAPLPRRMPAGLGHSAVDQSRRVPGAADQAAWTTADHTPMSIPQIADASGPTSMMKPDPDDAGNNPGFQFPTTMPPSLSDAANSLRSGNIDQAGRDLSELAAQKYQQAFNQSTGAARNPSAAAPSANLVPPPSTRSAGDDPRAASPAAGSNFSAPAFAPPPFTGSSGAPSFSGDANPASGSGRSGAPSTDPNQRDNSWRDYAGTASGSPSTSPAGNTAFGANPSGNDARGNDATGLRPNDTFGRSPAGLSSTAAFQQNPTANPAPSYSPYDPRRSGSGEPTYGANATNSAGLEYAATEARGARTPTAPPTPRPDERLSAAQVAAGAWSIDLYGRVFDRQGYPMSNEAPPATRPTSDQGGFNYASGSGQDPRYVQTVPSTGAGPRWDSDSIYRTQQNPATVAAPLPTDSRNPATFATTGRGSERADGFPRTDSAALRAEAELQAQFEANRNNQARTQQVNVDRDPPSLSDRRSAPPTYGPSPLEQSPEVSAQPLFNGLLLISFVANVYLIFWLKNLRLQYHDMVAAKRLAGSNSPAS